MSESSEDKVRRYTENLKSGDDPKRALRRLFELQVSSKTFQELGTRKAAKRYRDHEECKKYAERLCKRLKELEKKRTRALDSKSDAEPPMKQLKKGEMWSNDLSALAIGASSHEKKETAKKVDYSKYKITKKVPRIELKEQPQPTSSSSQRQRNPFSPIFDTNPIVTNEVPRFELKEQPQPTSSSSQRQRNPFSPVFDTKPIVSKDSVPSSRTLPPRATKSRITSAPVQSEASRADENMFKPRKERQKVFAGRVKTMPKPVLTEVPSLLSASQDVITANFATLLAGHVGFIRYDLLRPALLRLNLEQLRNFCDFNPFLAEDADEFFMDMVKKEFPKYVEKKGSSTWRQLYDRLVIRRDEDDKNKLEMLKKRLGKAAQQQQDTGRKTMVIETAHTANRRAGAVPIMAATPSGFELSKARKNVKTQGAARLNSLQAPARAAVRVAGSSTTSASRGRNAQTARKVAPLMAKVKKMLRR